MPGIPFFLPESAISHKPLPTIIAIAIAKKLQPLWGLTVRNGFPYVMKKLKNTHNTVIGIYAFSFLNNDLKSLNINASETTTSNEMMIPIPIGWSILFPDPAFGQKSFAQIKSPMVLI